MPLSVLGGLFAGVGAIPGAIAGAAIGLPMGLLEGTIYEIPKHKQSSMDTISNEQPAQPLPSKKDIIDRNLFNKR